MVVIRRFGVLALFIGYRLMEPSNLSRAIYISVILWDGGNVLEFPLFLDLYSRLFLLTVGLISSAVYTFSIRYIINERFFRRFHLILLSFVISMSLLILSPNLVSLLIGWDGLGLTSYLLVIYFQRSKSFNAGMLTALTNRLGDGLLLAAIGIAAAYGSWNLILWHTLELHWWGLFAFRVVVGGCTKRAQIPFSAWLPAAMAAPTPVSSLVHSSTLVTAGVYLIFRYSSLLHDTLVWGLVLRLGTATIVIAGIAAIVEIDIKKVVALSTLRQLGVIIVSLGCQLYVVAFFHLICHAFFKALLFLTIGNIIHISNDYQDIRKTGILHHYAPLTLAFRLRANLSLCGLPFRAGFYSKDLCIELAASSCQAWFFLSIFYVATALTAAYTVRLIWVTQCIRTSHVLLLRVERDKAINLSILILFPAAVRAGSWALWVMFFVPKHPALLFSIKNLTLCVIVCGIGLRGFKIIKGGPSILKLPNQVALIIWGLPFLSSRIFAFFIGRWGSINRQTHDLMWQNLIIQLNFSWSSTLTTGQRNLRESLFLSWGLIAALLGVILWRIFI